MIIARRDWDDNVSGQPYDEEKDHKNDIWIENGTFAMCDGKEAHAQTIAAVILTVQGEIQINREYGIPYFSTIFTSLRGQTLWAAAVREAVMELSFVEEIQDFTYAYDPTTHHFNYELTVKTTGNEVIVVSRAV